MKALGAEFCEWLANPDLAILQYRESSGMYNEIKNSKMV